MLVDVEVSYQINLSKSGSRTQFPLILETIEI